MTRYPWIRESVRVFGFLIPAEIRTFDLGDAAAAKAWIVA